MHLYLKHFKVLAGPFKLISGGSRASACRRLTRVRPFRGTVLDPLPTSSGDGAESRDPLRPPAVLEARSLCCPPPRRSRNPEKVEVGDCRLVSSSVSRLRFLGVFVEDVECVGDLEVSDEGPGMALVEELVIE